MNGWTFEAKAEWVVKIDNGPRYATRFVYTTKGIKGVSKNGDYIFQCENPKAAIQQVLITFGKGLKNIFFVVEKISSHSQNSGHNHMKETEKIVTLPKSNATEVVGYWDRHGEIYSDGKISVSFKDFDKIEVCVSEDFDEGIDEAVETVLNVASSAKL